MALALALLRRCLLLGPLGLRTAGGQHGDGCGHTLLTPQSGTLSSRNYPGTYPNHTTCRWRLRTPPGTFLLLTFGDVDLEPSERCASSSLLLTDPQAGISYGPYCRNAVPATPLLVTNSSTVTVLFNSTSHRSGRGLLLSYATTQHPDLVSCLVRGTHYTQEHISVYCPAGCKDIDGDIWGNPSQGYRDTSVLCKAAVHAGVIADEQGGQVTLAREKGITLYESAFANGLHSKRGSLSEKRLLFHKGIFRVAPQMKPWFGSQPWCHPGSHPAMSHCQPVLMCWRWLPSTPRPGGTRWMHWARTEPGGPNGQRSAPPGTRGQQNPALMLLGWSWTWAPAGTSLHDYYVKSYCVSSSRDGKNWRPYRGSSGQEDKVFEGNTDSHGEVSNAFIPPIVGRYVRVTPQSWHQRMAMKVALLGCQSARGRAPRPYAPSVPREVPVPTSHAPIPGVALDPEKAGSTLLLLLLIGGFVLLSSSLLVLAFLCRRKRKPAAELNCGTMKGHPKLDPSPVCSLQTLPPPGSTLASFPTAPAPGDLMSPEYAEPDLLQLSPSSQPAPSTFKPPLDEGYTLPLVLSHYDTPGRHHEYAEPLPPEPEYATPFTEPEPAAAGVPMSPSLRYHTPAPRPAELPWGGPGGAAWGDSPGAEATLSHVYQEAL
ncbi:discoidin, CUB and LCCL domain-containing protein 1-like isoform 1-T1 [Amazona ochrocephala]